MEILLAALLSCADGKWILDVIADTDFLAGSDRTEIIVEVLQAMPDNCDPEQYVGEKDSRFR